MLATQPGPKQAYSGGPDVTFIRAASIGNRDSENDVMTLWVHKDHPRLDRYVLAPGEPRQPVEAPITVWTCKGRFSEYRRPALPARLSSPTTAPARTAPAAGS